MGQARRFHRRACSLPETTSEEFNLTRASQVIPCYTEGTVQTRQLPAAHTADFINRQQQIICISLAAGKEVKVNLGLCRFLLGLDAGERQ